MTKSEIIDQIQNLLQSEESLSSFSPTIESLSLQFEEERTNSEAIQRSAHIEGGSDPIEFSYKNDESDIQFSNLIATFNQRIEKEKLKVKNLGKNFQIANQLQSEWNALPNEKSEIVSGLEAEYKHLLDTFYYDAKIVKDAIELDYQHNLASKKEVVEKIKGLSIESDVKILEQKIRQYEREWFRVGPVKRELRDETKEELESAVASLKPKLDLLYESEGALLKENLGKKIAICEQLNELLGKQVSSPKQFQQVSDQVIALQKEWKGVGRSDEHDRVWEVFRGACDSFFTNKRDFFKNLALARKDNKTKKLSLIKKAEKVSTSTDWKETATVLIGLQNEWKTIGPAHPAEDQKLWEKFRASCDVFFNARKTHFKDRNKEYDENLVKKKELIVEINQFVATGNTGKDVSELQGFENAYQAIGYVPFKEKDEIHKQFYNALNDHYKKINIDRSEKEKMRYSNRIQNMASGRSPERTLDYEKNKIKQELVELETKLSHYNNNINVVSSGKDNPLVKMIEKNISETEKEIKRKRMQLSLIKYAKTKKHSTEEE